MERNTTAFEASEPNKANTRSVAQWAMTATLLLFNIAVFYAHIYLENGVPFEMTLGLMVVSASSLLYAFNHGVKRDIATKVVIVASIASILFCIITTS